MDFAQQFTIMLHGYLNISGNDFHAAVVYTFVKHREADLVAHPLQKPRRMWHPLRATQKLDSRGARVNNRRLLCSPLVGAVFTLVPLIIERSTESTPWRGGAGLFMMPGILVGMAFAGGVVHEIGWQILVVVNFVFYSGVLYLILAIRARLRARSGAQVLGR
jgi:hypothetical protein